MIMVNRARIVSRFSPLTNGFTYKVTLVWDVKYHLARDVYTLVLEHVSRTKSVKYSEIVKLSQRLRDVTPVTFSSLLSSHQQHQPSSPMLRYLCSQYQFHSEHLRARRCRTVDIKPAQPSFSCTNPLSSQHCWRIPRTPYPQNSPLLCFLRTGVPPS
jgi:hypothetical protein